MASGVEVFEGAADEDAGSHIQGCRCGIRHEQWVLWCREVFGSSWQVAAAGWRMDAC